MGYRSDVVLVMKKAAFENMMAAIDTYDDYTDEQRNEIRNFFSDTYCDTFSDPEGNRLIKWDSVKWYTDDKEDYPDVDFVESFINYELGSSDFSFIRIGENVDDVEERGNYWNNYFQVSVRREFEFNPEILKQKENNTASPRM